ncbi:MAG TPA: AraC family transcriptional regulator [Methylophilaceae bacterium]|nr:AraC family transcriptional regulator [Methylophilaceae bacterium]
MDALSRFLLFHPVGVSLDYRCELSAPWRLENNGTAPGIAPYHIVTEGSARLEVSGVEPAVLSAGDVVMLPRGHSHVLHAGGRSSALPERVISNESVFKTLKNSGTGARTEVLCGEFVFDMQTSGLLVQSLPDVLLIRTQESQDHYSLQQLMLLLKKETKTPLPGTQVIVQHLASALFSLLIRSWVQSSQLSRNLWSLLVNPRLSPAVKSILMSPDKRWSIEQLAALCHMSRATFIRVFTQAAGNSPGYFLTETRLLHAMQLLSQRELNISNICERVGYSSEPAFHRIFKKRMGMTPGEFRQRKIHEA